MVDPLEFVYLSKLEIAIAAIVALWPYMLVIITSLAAILLWVQKMGWIHIGTSIERRKYHECTQQPTIKLLNTDITRIGTRVNGLEKKIDRLDGGQDRIETKIDEFAGAVREHLSANKR